MAGRLLAVFVAGVAATLIAVSPAFASLADEVSAGQAVAAQAQSGKTSCNALSDAQFKHLGEYVMDRMVASRAAHEAMNARMSQAVGVENADRMHELMGRRFAGCATGSAAGDMSMCPGMMSGSGHGGGWGMMSSSDWGWMHSGSWQQMSQSQWRQLASTMMGARFTSGDQGWSTGAVVAVVLGALLLGALLAVLLVRRPWRHRPPEAPSTT